MDYAQGWIDSISPVRAYSTITEYESILRRELIPRFGKKLLEDIKRKDIQALVADMSNRGLSPKTISNVVQCLSALMTNAYHDELIEKNPCSLVRVPKRSLAKADPFAPEDIRSILKYFQKYRPTEVALIATGFFTGARLSELAGLQWGDIDWNKKQITFRRVITHGKQKDRLKTCETRTIDLIEPLIPYLEAQKGNTFFGPDDWVFLNTEGEPFKWPGQDIAKRWKPVLKALGIRYRGPGQMRHTFACRALDQGESEAWVVTMLGHASREMVRKVYGNWIPEPGSGGSKLAAMMSEELPSENESENQVG